MEKKMLRKFPLKDKVVISDLLTKLNIYSDIMEKSVVWIRESKNMDESIIEWEVSLQRSNLMYLQRSVDGILDGFGSTHICPKCLLKNKKVPNKK